MNTYEERQLALKERFDVKRHARLFIAYCEVIIYPDGKIEYAVPSHNEALINAYAAKYNLTREEVIEKFRYDDKCYDKIMKDTGIIQIWYDYMINATPLTRQQHVALGTLLEHRCISARIYDSLVLF